MENGIRFKCLKFMVILSKGRVMTVALLLKHLPIQLSHACMSWL